MFFGFSVVALACSITHVWAVTHLVAVDHTAPIENIGHVKNVDHIADHVTPLAEIDQIPNIHQIERFPYMMVRYVNGKLAVSFSVTEPTRGSKDVKHIHLDPEEVRGELRLEKIKRARKAAFAQLRALERLSSGPDRLVVDSIQPGEKLHWKHWDEFYRPREENPETADVVEMSDAFKRAEERKRADMINWRTSRATKSIFSQGNLASWALDCFWVARRSRHSADLINKVCTMQIKAQLRFPYNDKLEKNVKRIEWDLENVYGALKLEKESGGEAAIAKLRESEAKLHENEGTLQEYALWYEVDAIRRKGPEIKTLINTVCTWHIRTLQRNPAENQDAIITKAPSIPPRIKTDQARDDQALAQA
ncbi:hypothetical protein PTTG_25817 [Puccinia triticina 1-1 BBBD Race 1]|uniref:Uncharacterized protein n=1 Tax=Puccinia triticina (isolate 1-1 / race 1 (BBBD)) TaxID=630390 RepID=A0A180GZH8_PUCT1|nr:hypothetical protein PTTG_25817 [Puccinia triticina 1-1 BBBD Race 1]